MKPILKKILEPSPWWGPYNPLTGFAYNFKTNQYMSRGYTIPISTAVTEGRTTDAHVLDADGTYVLRSANEPAQANGHGLDGFDETVNLFNSSEDLTGGSWAGGANVTVSLVSLPNPANLANVTKIAAVGTSGSTYVRQGRTASADKHTGSFVVKQGVGRYMGVRVYTVGGGGFQAHVPFDFDTGTFPATLSPEFDGVEVIPLSGGWYEVTAKRTTATSEFRFAGVCISNSIGSENPTLVGDEYFHVLWGDSTEASFKAPHFDGTRDADDTRVVQGAGPELYNSANLVTPVGFDTTHTVTATGFDAIIGATEARIAANLSNVVIGATYIVEFGPLPTSLACFAREDIDGTGTVLASAGPGETSLTFVATTTDMSLLFALVGSGFSIVDLTVKAVTIAPGFSANPDELTFRVDWDGVASTSSFQYLLEVINSSNQRIALVYTSTNSLWWGGDGTGSFLNIDVGSSTDDQGAHTAVMYCNRATGEFKISVDGAAAVSSTLAGAVPSNLDMAAISRRISSATSQNTNGTNCRIQVSEGDFFEAFRDSSAGFF